MTGWIELGVPDGYETPANFPAPAARRLESGRIVLRGFAHAGDIFRLPEGLRPDAPFELRELQGWGPNRMSVHFRIGIDEIEILEARSASEAP